MNALPAAILAALDDPDVCGNRTDRGPCARCVQRAQDALTNGTPVDDLLAGLAEFRAEGARLRTKPLTLAA